MRAAKSSWMMPARMEPKAVRMLLLAPHSYSICSVSKVACRVPAARRDGRLRMTWSATFGSRANGSTPGTLSVRAQSGRGLPAV
eukprot:1869969-Prymnesium_polylepis.1